MTKIKLLNNETLMCKTVEIQNGTLVLETTTEKTAEELHRIFSNKSNLNIIELQTESGTTLGSKYGFVCYAGITLLGDGSKKIELIQEKDPTEQRLTRAETQALQASMDSNKAVEQTDKVVNQIKELQTGMEQAVAELTMSLSQTQVTGAEKEEGEADVQ
nr:MAG TPA: hypothetical protein [Caudoviricetes sp.]